MKKTKHKITEFAKRYICGFIIGGFLFGTISIYATTYFPSNNTTYDNSKSGMNSNNVQDALDEVYNTCK